MADTHSKTVRSYNMSRIRSKDTKPELAVRKYLFAHGFRYRLHENKLPGKPDIVLPKYNTVIFVHGCFWHAHSGCTRSVIPKSNEGYWGPKIAGNLKRDIDNELLLREAGWQIIVIWECELKNRIMETSLNKIVKQLTAGIV